MVLGAAVTGFSALILDFDGTLFDLPVDWPAVRAELGLPAAGSITDRMQRSIDVGDAAAMAVVTGHELAAVPQGRFTGGARRLLADVPSRCPTAVLTRNSAACVRAALGGLADGVLIIGREDVRRLKPDPEGVHTALARLGAGPAACLLVGDTEHDVLAARAAGVRCAVVANPALAYRPEGADHYLDSLSTLRHYLPTIPGCSCHGPEHRSDCGR